MRCPSCFSDNFNPPVCPQCGYHTDQRREAVYLPSGTSLHNGEYIVGTVLGKPGGFGITYLAWDTRLDIKVAIKEYLPFQIAARSSDGTSVSIHTQDYRTDFEFGMGKFFEEAKILAQFKHPNIIRVMNFFHENRTAYMVMDYIKGESLTEYLARVGKLTGPDAVTLFLPILDGLAHIHAKNVYHRDIKPANIYLTEEGQAILLDFGSARQSIMDRSQSLTAVVTPGFAPWEQYHRKGKQGPWTDVYSCAATLYFMLTGTLPPDGTDRLVDDDLLPLSKLVPGLDLPISAAVMQGLALNPEERPQLVKEFAKQLSTTSSIEIMPKMVSVEPSQVRVKSMGEAPQKRVQSGLKEELKYFGEDDDFIQGECPTCKRILSVPWQSVWFSGKNLEVNNPDGIKCPCGLAYKKIGEKPAVELESKNELNIVRIAIEGQKENDSGLGLFDLLGLRTPYASSHRCGDTVFLWIKSPFNGIVEYVWVDKETSINVGVTAVIIFDQSNNIKHRITLDHPMWVNAINIFKGDRVSIGQKMLQVSSEKPLKDGEFRWFFQS